ncbi:MAG: hydrogenase formation protein HypD [Deferribacterota bacterium]|nr:hydrogenase formation protein HypD [Deferribacterota bacterium]
MNILEDFSKGELNNRAFKHVFAKAKKLSSHLNRKITLMEVCGTHTVELSKSGIRRALSEYLDLRSGPGCPVCVTDQRDIDAMISISQNRDVIITTFGDMLRVPGTQTTLEVERSCGANIVVCYSPMDALKVAIKNKNSKVVLLGIGFETTIPLIALSIKHAKIKGINNFSIYPAVKQLPPALEKLLSSKILAIDGLIMPGHVSTILGENMLKCFLEKYSIPSVITGFEPLDLLRGIDLLLSQIENGVSKVENAYKRAVSECGNKKAKALILEVFQSQDAYWRGLGKIAQSGLKPNEDYNRFDARYYFKFPISEFREIDGCRCGDVIIGRVLPIECELFGNICTPKHPIGPCMVSSEGACAAYYLYSN